MGIAIIENDDKKVCRLLNLARMVKHELIKCNYGIARGYATDILQDCDIPLISELLLNINLFFVQPSIFHKNITRNKAVELINYFEKLALKEELAHDLGLERV